MISKSSVKVLDGKLSRIEELELRLMNLEAIIKDIKVDIVAMRDDVKEVDSKKVEKLKKYQKVIDSLWLTKSPAM
jgi:hypothetical protein